MRQKRVATGGWVSTVGVLSMLGLVVAACGPPDHTGNVSAIEEAFPALVDQRVEYLGVFSDNGVVGDCRRLRYARGTFIEGPGCSKLFASPPAGLAFDETATAHLRQLIEAPGDGQAFSSLAATIEDGAVISGSFSLDRSPDCSYHLVAPGERAPRVDTYAIEPVVDSWYVVYPPGVRC